MYVNLAVYLEMLINKFTRGCKGQLASTGASLQCYLFWQLRVDWHALKAIYRSGSPMEIIYFTLTAILLYLAADWILRRMETAAGKRFEKRSLIFFAILMTMAVTSFGLIRTLTGQ
jgi:hypothetical protein